MEINTQSLHFDADASLLEFIEKKLEKLETFYDKIVNADVILRLENTGQVRDKLSEIKLHVPGTTLVAKETCKSFEEGVDAAVESLRRQLKKYKEKLVQRGRTPKGPVDQPFVEENEDALDVDG